MSLPNPRIVSSFEDDSTKDGLFAGGGEMGALCRAFDWSATPLGPVDDWSRSLRTTVATVLNSRHPMFLWWGPDLIQFYNDGYRPSLGEGGRHPRALGMRGREFWTDIWDIIYPQIQGVMERGTATWHEDQLVAIERNERIEEVYWTYSYSPVMDDDGSIGGTLVVCQETSRTVIAQRRLRTLHQLAALPLRGSPREIAAKGTQILASEALDVPFALCYLTAPDAPHAHPDLVHAAGVPREVPAEPWPLRAAIESREPQVVDVRGWEELEGAGPWPETPTSAVVLTVMSPGGDRVVAALVAGLSARLPWSDGYREFLIGAANHLGSQIVAREVQEHHDRRGRELEVERSRLAYIFQQAPAFLAVLRGPEHTFELVNDAYYQVVGHRDLVGKPVLEALPEVRGQGFLELLDGVRESREPFVGREVPILLARTPGAPPEERFLDFVYMPLIEADGTTSGIIAHGMDVTDHVLARGDVERLLRESEQARADAEAASQVKTRFLASVSHELRTPINGILGYAELLRVGIRGSLNGDQRHFVDRIKSSSAHLMSLIDRILDLSKVEAGGLELELRRAPIRETVRAALGMIQPLAEAKEIQVSDSVSSRPDASYLGDPDRVRQILVNLLSNAIKFTDGGGRVTLGCDSVDDPAPELEATGEGPWIAVAVEDSGPGIPRQHLTRIFEPFVQVDGPSTYRAEQGTGLGLSISRELAREMGGDLTVQSELGEGSCFTLWLPASPEED